MKNRIFILPLLLFFLVTGVSAQTIEKPEKKDGTEFSPEMKKQAVEFLRETSADVGGLRTLENRIGFSSELAALMWYQDEREARAMMNQAIGDFKQLLAQYDAQLNAMGFGTEDGPRVYSGFLGSSDQSDRAKLARKLGKAVTVRQQVASSIAEHDPQLALDFYESSAQLVTNVQARKQFDAQDSYFMTKLVGQIAEKDAAKAAEAGRKSLANGVNYSHLELAKKIYAKDADKGAEFAAEMVKKLREKSASGDYYMIGATLSMGADNFETAAKEKKKPMFSEAALRDLADALGQQILNADESFGLEYLNSIEKFAPARAAQIRSRMSSRMSNRSAYGSNMMASNANVAASNSNMTVSVANMSGTPAATGTPTPVGEGTKTMSAEDTLEQDLERLKNKELPPEEREKVIAQARKIILEIPDKTAKITALSGIAAQVFKLGDRDLAAQIMSDAQALVNPQPKNYQDFMEHWILASGYAEGDAEKAFPILDDTIMRLNMTLAAFIKVGEFIDVSGEMIEDGEVQIGSFGGSLVRDLTGGLGMATGTLRSLAHADFAKTRALTNRFEQPEARILAKMLVLRAVFGGQKKAFDEPVVDLTE